MLITCETPEQFTGKLKALEQKLPLLFEEKGKAWLDKLFAVIKKFKEEKEHEPGTETESAADIEGTSQPDAAALSEY